MSTAGDYGPRTTQADVLYGPYASLVQKVGKMAEAACDADRLAMDAASGSVAGDSLTAGTARATRGEAGLDDAGRSEHTHWINGMAEHISDVRSVIVNLHRDVAEQCSARWREQARPQDNLGDGIPDDLVLRSAFVSDPDVARAVQMFQERQTAGSAGSPA